jgi:hypothetical protein
MAGALGPGETTGSPDPTFQIDFKLSAGAYDGFEDWTIGSVNAKTVKPRVKIVPATGAGYISSFTLVVDTPERSAHAEGVVVSTGGTAVVFDEPFHTTPNVQITAEGATPLYPVKSSVSSTGFTVTVYDEAGNDVGGTVDWTATGA